MSSIKIRRSSRPHLILVMAVVVATACGGEPSGAQNSTSAITETARASNPGKMFDESVKEDKCDLLTPAQVTAAAGIVESAIETTPGFCLYEWEGHNIFLTSVRVHDSVERASRYYARHTEDGNTVTLQYGNVTAEFSGKTYDRTEGEDWVSPETARAIAHSNINNLDEAG